MEARNNMSSHLQLLLTYRFFFGIDLIDLKKSVVCKLIVSL